MRTQKKDHPPVPGATALPSITSPQPGTPLAEPTTSNTKILLVDFRSGEAVCDHPDVAPLLGEGWVVRSAVPRIVETEGTKLLVVLAQAAARVPGLPRQSEYIES